ncbi:MAG: acetyl-CoA carboxylase carboxyltransferase subunit alpha [Nitrospinae bacterium]|nr:acetyl-CoA carboxylase carboxyltransferase subunit alpha [Nitrospinota bacterium]
MQVLELEEPIFNLEQKVEELIALSQKDGIDLSDEIAKLRKKIKRKQRDVFAKLSSWERTLMARHPDRPYTKDYIDRIITDFMELHGERAFSEGPSIVGGIGKLDGRPVVVIGHQKGRDTKEKLYRNFGMPMPDGFRKALRLMKFAAKFKKPIIAFMDTPGAFPGIEAEERGQAGAIAENLKEMALLPVPMISVVIGEGGSGGALAIGMGNRVLMLENAVYSVISPEGCAAILWGGNEKMKEAAEALSITAQNLKQFRIIDEIIKEPLGGAHKDYDRTASILRRVLRRNLNELCAMSPEDLINQRLQKYRVIGEFVEM